MNKPMLRRNEVLPEDKTLLLAVVNVTLQIQDVVGGEEVPSIGALDDTCWRSRGTRGRVATVRD